ncbi:hypothetical protein [Thiolinea disciformis]|uniref:hypothetical protein n=1 Tax=Thiolinea disciformis TaxID=125614 RepID=UPI00037BEE42|nr:hypothetical protein [Thiolinea disciformis]
MPIRKDLKPLYPANWKQLSTDLKAKAGWECQGCGMPQYGLAFWDEGLGRYQLIKGNRFYDQLEYTESYKSAIAAKQHLEQWCDYPNKLIIIVLTVAHLDHDPTNNDPSNLRVLCGRCHLQYDEPHHRANRVRNARCGKTIDMFEP